MPLFQQLQAQALEMGCNKRDVNMALDKQDLRALMKQSRSSQQHSATMPAMSKMQADLDADVVRVDLAFLSGTGAVLTVTLRVDGLPDVQIDVLPDDTVLDTVQEALGFKPKRILLGSRPVEGGTFGDAGVEDMATLTVVGRRVATAVTGAHRAKTRSK